MKPRQIAALVLGLVPVLLLFLLTPSKDEPHESVVWDGLTVPQAIVFAAAMLACGLAAYALGRGGDQ